MKTSSVDVLIIGGGPAGLACAIELRALGIKDVRVVDREADAGGVPRHSNHLGYGIRDLHRFMTGPAYAKSYVERAQKCGVTISTSTTATQLGEGTYVDLSSPQGLERVHAKAIVLATGARERGRNARMIPGARPAGIYTTGSLQQALYLRHLDIGTKAVIIGAEHVSFSALMTLSHAKVKTLAMITDQSKHSSVLGAKLLSQLIYRFRFIPSTEIVEIHGNTRVTGITIRDDQGNTSSIDCDTIIFTGNWIPDYELARRGKVDSAGVFAIGNLHLPIKSADQCAVLARKAAKAIAEHVSSAPALKNG